MKTNVSIKFNSIEEYREIEKKLEELGYVNDKDFKNIMRMCMYNKIRIFKNKKFIICPDSMIDKTAPIYNSLEEFLKD